MSIYDDEQSCPDPREKLIDQDRMKAILNHYDDPILWRTSLHLQHLRAKLEAGDNIVVIPEALFLIARFGDKQALLRLLEVAPPMLGEDCQDACDYLMAHALHKAQDAMKSDMIDLLIHHGAPIDWFAVMSAAAKGDYKLVKLGLERGACNKQQLIHHNIHAGLLRTKSAYMAYRFDQNAKLRICQMLVEHGVPVPSDVLSTQVTFNDLKTNVVQYMVQQGAVCTGTKPPLALKYMYDHSDSPGVLSCFLSRGAPLNTPYIDSTGRVKFALIECVKNLFLRTTVTFDDTFCALLAYGADATVRDSSGMNCIDNAVYFGGKSWPFNDMDFVFGSLYALGCQASPGAVKEWDLEEKARGSLVRVQTMQLDELTKYGYDICVSLHNLRLPALLMIEILDQSVEVAQHMEFRLKWDFVCAIKHFNGTK